MNIRFIHLASIGNDMTDSLRINLMFSSVDKPFEAGQALSTDFDIHVSSDDCDGVMAVLSGKLLDCSDLSDWGVNKGAASLHEALCNDPHTSQLLRLMVSRDSHILGVAPEASSALSVRGLKKIVCINNIRFRKDCRRDEVIKHAIAKMMTFCGLTAATFVYPHKLKSGALGSGIFSSPIKGSVNDGETFLFEALTKCGFKSFFENDIFVLGNAERHRLLSKTVGIKRTNGSVF